MKKSGMVRVTHELLHELLKFPDGTHIDEILITEKDKQSRAFSIMLSGDHPRFYERLEGQYIAYHPLKDIQK